MRGYTRSDKAFNDERGRYGVGGGGRRSDGHDGQYISWLWGAFCVGEELTTMTADFEKRGTKVREILRANA